MNRQWKKIGARVVQKARNKVLLALYLKRNKLETLNIECNEKDMEEKWPFKKTQCYDEKKSFHDFAELLDVSIIVPLYNSEKFIHNCVWGFINQETNYMWELILVNDGSTDNTLAVAQNYQQEYPDRIVVIDQDNRGIAGARNTGIGAAKGRYIGFVDHDDQIGSHFIDKLLSAAYKEDADIVKSAFADIWNGKVKKPQEKIDEVIYGDMKEKLFDYKGYIFPAVYKRELFKHIRFPEDFWYEDIIVRTLLYRQSQKYVHISDVLYYKNFHANNASFSVWDITNYKCLEQLYLVINLIEENKKMGLPEDAWFYQCIMHELSFILSLRVRKLDEKTRQSVFLKACNIVKGLYKEEYEGMLTEKNKMWQRIFLQKEYKLWLLLSGHY